MNLYFLSQDHLQDTVFVITIVIDGFVLFCLVWFGCVVSLIWSDFCLLFVKGTIDLPILSSSSSNNNNSDAEPWRCRRTDGKKWRCSRDVAPDQKYCERHSHKSRPRSRKHVEQQQQQRLNKNDQIINHSLNKFVNSPTLLSSMASSDEQRFITQTC